MSLDRQGTVVQPLFGQGIVTSDEFAFGWYLMLRIEKRLPPVWHLGHQRYGTLPRDWMDLRAGTALPGVVAMCQPQLLVIRFSGPHRFPQIGDMAPVGDGRKAVGEVCGICREALRKINCERVDA